MDTIIPQRQLLIEIKRFVKDKARGISVENFADIAGMSAKHFRDVFIEELHPMTYNVQVRVSRAYRSYQRGEIVVMQNRDNTRFAQYRKEAKPHYVRSTGLQVVDGQIKIKIGIRNAADYSQENLDEQLGGNNG